jgi:hypothetical protein
VRTAIAAMKKSTGSATLLRYYGASHAPSLG